MRAVGDPPRRADRVVRANTHGMLTLLLRHAVRRLVREWGRAFLLLAAIGLGISVFVAVLYASDASVRSFRSSLTSFGGEDSVEIRARSGALSRGELASLYPALRHRFDTLAFWEGRGVTHGVSLDVLAFDPVEAESRFEWPGRNGATGDGDGEAAWWGSSRLLRKLGVLDRAGTLTVLIGGKELTLPMRALPEELGHHISGDALLTTLGATAPIREKGGVTGIKLFLRPGGGRELFGAIGRFLEGDHERRLYLANPQARAAQAERLFAAFRLNIGVLVLMTLVVCAFVVFGAAQLSVLTLQRELGIMRTIGFSRPLLGAVILAESVLVGVSGTILGLTIGRPITEWCARLFLNTVSVLYGGGGRPDELWGRSFTEILLLSFGVGVGLSLLGAVLPALRAAKIPPGIVARSRGIVPPPSSRRLHRATLLAVVSAAGAAIISNVFGVAAAAHVASFGVVGGVVGGSFILLDTLAGRVRAPLARVTGVPGLLAAANIISGARIVGVAAAVNGVGLSLLIGLGLMVSSFRHTLGDWIEYTIRGDLFVRSIELGSFDRPSRLPPQFEAIAANTPGIDDTIGFASFELDTGTTLLTVGGQEFSHHPRARSFHLISGQLSPEDLANDDAVLISESASRKLGVTTGDSLSIAGVSTVVRGVFKDYSSEHGIVLFELTRFRKLFGAVPLTSAVIVLEEGDQLENVARSLADSPIGRLISVQRNVELREAIFSIFDQTFQITDLMRFIVAVICALGFVLTALQLHEERRHEIRTLVTLGLSRAGLQGSVLFEGLLIVTPGIVLGAVGGTVLALILIHLVNPLSFGWTLHFVPTIDRYVWPIAVVLCSTVIAAALVALRSTAVSWRQEVEDGG